jgi:hypothetical protein
MKKSGVIRKEKKQESLTGFIGQFLTVKKG